MDDNKHRGAHYDSRKAMKDTGNNKNDHVTEENKDTHDSIDITI